MINSFRRMRTGKRTGDGEADGSGGSCSGCSAVRAAAALFPRMASGERSEAPTAAGASSFLFLVLLFLRLSPVGGGGEGSPPPPWPAASGAKPPPQQEPAAAELNFEMLIVVNNKFVDELAFVVFVFKDPGGTV